MSHKYPKPFKPTTTIRFELRERLMVSLRVYDINGREVKQVLHRVCEAGANVVEWDGTDARGDAVRSGTYIYILEAGELLETRKMVLMR